MMICRRHFIRTGTAGALGWCLADRWIRPLDLAGFGGASVLPRATPESQGVASAAISAFVRAANDSGIQWHSFMLMRHGQVIAEAWWKPFDPGYKHTLYSLSKSFTSTAIGFLVKEKKISVDDPVTSFFQAELPSVVSDNLAKMKVRHLLTMNTGHGDDTMPALRAAKDNWVRTFLAQPVTFEPGSHFLYNTGATYMLGAIVYKVTGDLLEDFLRSRLFKPLGISGYDWERSPDGLNTAGYGLRVKTEDIARFGQFYLQQGKWDGRELLPAAWIDEATRRQTDSQAGDGDWSQGYGYQFWRCKPGFYRGDGAYGQYCVVMPAQDAVLAITSESWNMQQSMTIAWEHLLPAMQESPLPENASGLATLRGELSRLTLPVVKGLPSTPLAARYNGKKFAVASNDFGVDELTFRFLPEGCRLILSKGKAETTIQCGWSKWFTNPGSDPYWFAPSGRNNVPSKIAGTATWVSSDTLQLNLRFVEAIHGDQLSVQFNKDALELRFLNSVSENVKNNPETRVALTATLQERK